MINRLIAASLLAGLSTVAAAEPAYLSCTMQTVFHKPYVNHSEWVHVENIYTKYFRIDSRARMVSVLNERSGALVPICAPQHTSCVNEWSAQGIQIDATSSPDDPAPPYLDFRRSLSLNSDRSKGRLIIADYGQSANGRANMYWSYEGACQSVTHLPKPIGPPNLQQPRNPAYQDGGLAKPLSELEQDRLLAGYYGNTMTGFSGGGHWFHMWFLDRHGLAYTSDDQDISGEGKVHQWYFGRDALGYRICAKRIPPEGRADCYPLLPRQPGDTFVEHDMDGDAQFTIMRGRQ
jgi:hypothetical protein